MPTRITIRWEPKDKKKIREWVDEIESDATIPAGSALMYLGFFLDMLVQSGGLPAGHRRISANPILACHPLTDNVEVVYFIVDLPGLLIDNREIVIVDVLPSRRP